jgi:formate-dependent nitrite reductase membrane component NrfD
MFGTLATSYLFLGGAGAGAQLLLIILDFLTPPPSGVTRSWARRRYAPLASHRPLLMLGFQTSTAVLVLSALCLAFDLGRPDRMLSLFLRPTLSYLTLGTYALSAAILCGLALAVIWSVPVRSLPRWAVRTIEWLGLLSSFVMMLYTGLLFQSIGTGTLLGTVLVPLLFVLSSLSTGLALLFMVACLTGAARAFTTVFARLIRLDMLLIAAELLALAALLLLPLIRPEGSISARALLYGSYAPVFWAGVIACGLVIPLVLESVDFIGRRTGARRLRLAQRQRFVSGVGPKAASFSTVKELAAPETLLSLSILVPTALMVLVGGFSLRWCLIGAGLPIFVPESLAGVSG